MQRTTLLLAATIAAALLAAGPALARVETPAMSLKDTPSVLEAELEARIQAHRSRVAEMESRRRADSARTEAEQQEAEREARERDTAELEAPCPAEGTPHQKRWNAGRTLNFS